MGNVGSETALVHPLLLLLAHCTEVQGRRCRACLMGSRLAPVTHGAMYDVRRTTRACALHGQRHVEVQLLRQHGQLAGGGLLPDGPLGHVLCVGGGRIPVSN